MKSLIVFLLGLLALVILASSIANAETPTLTCPSFAEAGSIPGTSLHYACAGSPDPAQCVPPSVPAGFGLCACNPPNTTIGGICTAPVVNSGPCDISQVSYTGLARQCAGYVVWPKKRANYYNGDLLSVDTVLRGTWGNYTASSGQTFTILVNTGQYISLALTATDATHGLQFGVDETFGQPGHIWLSDAPGAAPRSSVYGVCEGTASASLLIYPFTGYRCSISVGQTVYVNWSDGQPISYGVYGGT